MVTFRHDDASGTSASGWRAETARHDLPAVDLAALTRVVVLAAHPDDETLGAGGLVGRAHRLGLEVVVVVATRGEACHPRSPTHSQEQLAALRAVELDAAVALLSPGTRPVLLTLPDGGVRDHEDALVARLVDLVGDGRDTLLVAPWRGDGHADHEAVGRAAAATAARSGARLLEYPVWFWHWGDPAAAPWASGRRLDLDPAEQTTKQAAVAAHRTQVRPLSPAPGDEALLSADFLAHFAASYEVFWEGAARDDALDALHEAQADPWGVDRRWYERRKRALLLAMLPRERFRRGVEVGCSTGALAADLAARCDSLLALDASPSATTAALARLAGLDHVDVRLGSVPVDWPDGAVDLAVVSEVGYFLSPAALDGLAARLRGSLTPDGVVVLCHWRHPVVGWPLDGPGVHARLRSAGLPPVVAEYADRDVEVLVLADPAQLPDPHAG
ncbi:bifunctional PIG-L family deacetylase/class I SAM-dependent methyltransferase [Nocardioides rubriscoriae]|uniref:bifunctional PIG-L family deacetylase/class I SAM-dependent methyltransferase n=1 Tax=Nocardioides rubriscoriae TaxID=642762 RepID=UPI0011DFF1E3|nr:bifunctional PIG-L family deacetylase/class I SAM-dependent methyltransferase [Nocardioides rubriscoriae]